jgi:hypothetical protein
MKCEVKIYEGIKGRKVTTISFSSKTKKEALGQLFFIVKKPLKLRWKLYLDNKLKYSNIPK